MKKNHTYSRKGYALRLIAILLALIIAGHITSSYHVLPVQALHQLVNKEAVGDVEIVDTLYDPNIAPTPLTRYYLCANDDVLMLCGTRFHLLMGWFYEHACMLPLVGDDPVKVAYQNFHQNGEEDKLYVFGRVDDENVAMVDIEARYYYDNPDEFRSIHAQMGELEFIQYGNYRYFIKEISLLANPEMTYPEADYDHNGYFVSAQYYGGEPVTFVSEKRSIDDTDTERMIQYYSYTSFG